MRRRQGYREPTWNGKGEGLVYLVLRNDGLYKIGHTGNFKRRFRLMKYENRDYQLQLVHTMFTRCRINTERYWHTQFGDKRVWREWFRLSQEDVQLFCSYQTVGE